MAPAAVLHDLGADVGEAAIGVGSAHVLIHLRGVTGHQHPQPGNRGQRLHITGGVVGGALGAVVEGSTCADQDRAQLLVSQVVLDLLQRPLGHEGCDRVGDREKPFKCEAGGHPDHRLLHDPDVDRAGRITLERSPEVLEADLGQRDRDPRVLLEQLRHRRPGLSAHAGSSHAPSSMLPQPPAADRSEDG